MESCARRIGTPAAPKPPAFVRLPLAPVGAVGRQEGEAGDGDEGGSKRGAGLPLDQVLEAPHTLCFVSTMG